MTQSLAQLLNIDVPVIQAPIGSASCPALAAAVSNAGGLGMLAVSWRSPDAVRRMIRATRELTARRFGVNLVIEWPQEERLRACLDEGVRVVSFFWGDPNGLWTIAHDAGAVVLHQVGSRDEARRSIDAGTDAIVAQGHEAGGHVRGTTRGDVLLRELAAATADDGAAGRVASGAVPVIASGGIADAAGVARAIAAGAAGVWVGTRFVASAESAAHPYYKQRIVDASPGDAQMTLAFDGGWENAPHRALHNSSMDMFTRGDIAREVVAHFPNGEPIHRFDDTPPITGMTGDMEALAMYAGESAGAVRSVMPAADIVRELAAPFLR